MTLEGLTIYPVKSCGAVELQSGEVENRGLKFDRRWMIVDESGRFISQRELPALATIRPRITDEFLILCCGEAQLDVPLHPEHGAMMPVQVWRDEVEALCAGELADEWLGDVLGVDARLVWMPDNARRLVDATFAHEGEITSFSDGFPFLVATDASLRELNDRILENGGEPVGLDRFRANLLVSGARPFEEDEWARFRIGECEFEAVKPCARCPIPTIDQTTGEKRGPEPLRTLAQFRRVGSQVMFAQNALPRRLGRIQIGDEVEVLSHRS